MIISVIILTYNAENSLPALLKSLSLQIIQDFELIIIDSSSKDSTIEIAKKYTEKVLRIPQNEFDHGGTRTIAGQMAKGDLLVYFTQDAIPYNKFTLENIVKVFEDKRIGAAYGRQVSYPETNPFGKHLREFNYPNKSYIRDKSHIPQYGIKTAFLSNSFACYRRSALESIGWFKNKLILCEDIYAGAKLILRGYKIAYVSEAIVYHSHSYTILQEFKRYFDIGVFYECEKWIIDEFGKVDGEGIKYIKSELKYLINHGVWYLIPKCFFRNAMKYAGYKLGQRHKKMPNCMRKMISIHKKWWDKKRFNSGRYLTKID